MGRYKIEFDHGYISLDEAEKDKAFDIYNSDDRALRIKYCKDIFDDGITIDGIPEFEDMSRTLTN